MVLGSGLGGGGAEDKYITRLIVDTREAHRETKEFFQEVLRGARTASGGVQKLEQRMNRMSFIAQKGLAVLARSWDFLITTIFRAGAALAAFSAAFITQGIRMNATMETLLVSFTNMIGSEEGAIVLLKEIRKQVALVGGDFKDFAQFAQTARGLVPYAQGDLETLRQMLTVVQQLTVIDPIAGARGAGRALREALSGDMLSLVRMFELPRTELNKLKAEFQETGDVNAFLNSIQELLGAFGAGIADIEDFGKTAKGQIALFRLEVETLQQILTKPIFDALIENFGEFARMFNENKDTITQSAIIIGAQIAAAIDVMFAMVRDANVAFNQLVVIVEVAQINLANSIRRFGNNIREEIMRWQQQYFPNVPLQLGEMQEIVDPATALERGRERGGGLLADLIDQRYDYSGKVQEYIAATEEWLNADENALNEWASQNQQTQEEVQEDWSEYLYKFRDMFEQHYEQVQEETERHHEKLADIEEDALEARQDAWEDFGDEVADFNEQFGRDMETARESLADRLEEIEENTAESRRQIQKTAADQREEIEERYAERVREINRQVKRDMFDAVNARDARRVFEIMQRAREDTREAGRDRRKAIDNLKEETRDRLKELARRRRLERQEAREAFQEEVERLVEHRKMRMEDLQEELQERLAQIEEHRLEEIAAENEAHNKRLQNLDKQIKRRLQLLARGWAEEGKLTQEALHNLIDMASSVFGPSGVYLDLIKGFNEGLAFQAEITRQHMQSMFLASAGSTQQIAPGTYQTDFDPFMEMAIQDLESGTGLSPEQIQEILRRQAIGAQHGFNGVVNRETYFRVAEPGTGPEHVQITPLSQMGAGGQTIRVIVEGYGISEAMEADLSVKIAREVGVALAGPRRSRRR